MAYDASWLALDLKCFNTAVKPHVFRMLFDRGYRSVLYFDPDIHFYADFDENWAVFVPSFYPEKTYKVLVDPRYNAAYWNLHYRGAEIAYTSDSDVTYGGAPLVFFHFSGVSTDVINFDAISPHQTRYSLGDLPNLRPLLASYAAAVADSAYYREHSRYGLDAFDNGAPAPFWARDLYGPLSFKGRHAKAGPSSPKPAFADAILALDANPFATAPANSLWRWLFENRYDVIVDDCSEGGWLPNAALLLLDAFGIDTSRFRTAKGARTWFYHYGASSRPTSSSAGRGARPCEAVRRLVGAGRRRSHRSLELVGPVADDETSFCCEVVLGRACSARTSGGAAAASSHPRTPRPALWQSGLRAAAVANKDKECAADGPVDDFGVNVVGYVSGVFGVAELALPLPRPAIEHPDGGREAAGHARVRVPRPRHPDDAVPGLRLQRRRPERGHVAASPRPTLAPVALALQRRLLGLRARELPERFASGALIYDEIWATSEFTADAVRSALASDPVTAMIPVTAMPSHGDSADKAAVDARAAGWPNIQAIDDRLDDDVFASLKGAADCYVSLHRSEGCGLNVLEALLAGTPTIATTYSGNMDFMKHLPKPTLDALGVAWAPKTLDAAVGPYPKGGAWSEPSADDGARAMAHAASHRAEVRAAAVADAATLRAKFSADAQGAVQAARLKAVDGLRRSVPPVPDESIYCYWLKNTDIREALGNDLAAVTAHWNDQGQAEGRELACDWLSAAALQAAKLVLV
ncbi:glycosyl transferase [Aureococcus anophagefferens]|nr:glycosyl transferase [Aureococcus anophagefferens]